MSPPNKSTLQGSNFIRISLISTVDVVYYELHRLRITFRMTLIGILTILLVVSAISSQSYVKKASALFTPMHGIGVMSGWKG